MMFRDGKTTSIEVEQVEWHDSFLGCTRHLIAALRDSVQPVLDGPAGRAVLRFMLAAHIPAPEAGEMRPDNVK